MALISLFLGACNQDKRQAGWWDGEKERIELTHQLELKNYRFEQHLGSDFESLQKVRAASQQVAARRTMLESEKALLVAEVNSLQEKWVGFRTAAIQAHRQRVIGKSFDTFALDSGRSFEKVSISAISDSGVTIRHSDGSARLQFEDLNSEQRLLFGLEQDLALAAHQKETKSAAEYERWVDTRLASNQAKKKQEAETARLAEITASRTRADLMASQMASVNVSPLSRPSSSGVYSSSRSYRSRPTYYNTNYYSTGYTYCRPVVRSCYSPSQVRRGFDSSKVNNYMGNRSFANKTIP